MTEAVILLVDDDVAGLSAMRRALRREYYRVLTAEDAASALDVLDDERVDVVLSDHVMPGMSGLELLRHVRRRQPDVVRVLLSGRVDLQAALTAVNDTEVFRLLHKPVMREHLLATIEDALARRVSLASEGDDGERLASLTDRQRDVVELVASGFRVPQVAERLAISPHTVRNHLKAAFAKLGVHSQQELVERFGTRGR